MNIREFSHNLLKIYDEMWPAFSTYQKSTGLDCLSGCGKCCNNPEVEASAMEMIPLALKIWDEGKFDEWWAKLEDPKQDSCLMYEAHSPDKSKGQCGVYRERPSLCRMFGVAGYFNKHHEVTLSVCKLIKENSPDKLKEAEQKATLENTPMLANWSYRLSQLDPQLILNRMPINLALREALQKVALYAQYQET